MHNEIDKAFDVLEQKIFSQILQERNNQQQNIKLNSLIDSLKEEVKNKEQKCEDAKKTCIEVAQRLNNTIIMIKSILKNNAD